LEGATGYGQRYEDENAPHGSHRQPFSTIAAFHCSNVRTHSSCERQICVCSSSPAVSRRSSQAEWMFPEFTHGALLVFLQLEHDVDFHRVIGVPAVTLQNVVGHAVSIGPVDRARESLEASTPVGSLSMKPS
jgi:hypothetical protein